MKHFLRCIVPLIVPLFALAQSAAPAPLSMEPPEKPGEINPALPTIFIASDSTAARAKEPQQGWGVPFAAYFDSSKVNVVNRALGGRSSRTFITQGWWDKLLADLKAGDTVLIQFGHNDASAINDNSRARGVIRGLGEETEQIDNLLTKQPETVHTYGWYMRRMIADVRAKGATPIVLSITIRNAWSSGKIERNSPWRGFSRQIAAEAGTAFIDLSRLIADEYMKIGEVKVKEFFPRDATHTGQSGAELNAALVVAGLKGLRHSPYLTVLSPQGEAVEPDRIGWLNLPEPVDPKLPSLFLVGDSLVRNGRGDGEGGQWGWGDSLGKFFDPAKVNIVNRAVGGLSSRTYHTQGHWERALHLIKPGDFVVIQLGHNDPGPLNDTSRARGTIKGVGEETEEIDNLLTKEREAVHSFGWYLRKLVRDSKAAGATPIILSLTPRKTWKDGKIVRSGADSYGGWSRQVAEQEGVAFIDANGFIAARYEAMGPAKVDTLFGDANLHTNKAGADLNAKLIAAALHKLPGLAPYATDTKAPVLPLWPDGAPGSAARMREAEKIADQRVSNIHHPSIAIYLPAKDTATGCAVVIAPGGGHARLAIEHEGYAVGRWLAERGIAAFVLKYRLARDNATPEGAVQPYTVDRDALADAQRAIRLVRSRAQEWAVNPRAIGFIGFSAGGELALLAGIRGSAGNAAAADVVDRESSRPDFFAPIYPGGLQRTDLELQKDLPPVFLLCGANDRPGITELLPGFFVKCQKAGMDAELHIFAGAGHGFGYRENHQTPAGAWLERFRDWLADRKFLQAKS